MKKKIKKDKRKIPKGFYCYDHIEINKKNIKNKIIGICPYWSKHKNRPKQECGFCAYLNKGDWNINAKASIPISLLWDMIKECSINED